MKRWRRAPTKENDLVPYFLRYNVRCPCCGAPPLARCEGKGVLPHNERLVVWIAAGSPTCLEPLQIAMLEATVCYDEAD